ncbi:hypothetical protein MWH03_00210 [Klebsiella pneumoniae]|nr:hypothetical protein [Klebsiella pneumoniae]
MPVNKRNKHYPIFTDRKRSVNVGWDEFTDHLQQHGAYGFLVNPYYHYCVVAFGDERYLQAMRALFFVDMEEDVSRSAGMVTRPGNIPGTNNLLSVFLPEKYDAEIFWHEALHIAMMTLETHGVKLHEQEALTYLQCFVHSQLQMCHDMFLADRKAGLTPDIREIFTGNVDELNQPDYYSCPVKVRSRP